MSRLLYDRALKFESHKNSINAAAFSPDGRFLATGGDDFLLFIFDPLTGDVAHKLEGQSPVTAICWDPHEAGRLFVGYGTGRVLVAQTDSMTLAAHYLPRSTNDGPVEDLVCDCFGGIHRILICAGSRVEMWKEIENWRWVETHLEPPEFIITHARQSSGDEIVPRSGHIINDGRLAVITYLNHGIVCWDVAVRASFQWHMLPRTARLGRSSISSDGKVLAASNLYDGFDLYSLETRKHILTCTAPITLNIPLPVLMTTDGTELITGTPCGSLAIFDPTTGDEKAVLDHSNDIVQAIAYCDRDGTRFLATGSSERGDATSVKVWRRQLAPSDSSQPRRQAAIKQLTSRNLGHALIAKTYAIAVCLGALKLMLVAQFVFSFCSSGRTWLYRDRKVVGVTLTALWFVVLIGMFYDQPPVRTDLGIRSESSHDLGIWVTSSHRVADTLLLLYRYALVGSKVTCAVGRRTTQVLAGGAADVSVFIAQITVRLLKRYIVYMRRD